MKNKNTTIPFDISTIRTLEYNLSDLDEVENTKRALDSTIKSLNFTVEEKQTESISSTEELNKILNLLLNLENKIDKFNSEIISTLTEKMTEKIINSTRPKSDNEVIVDLIKVFATNPQSLNILMELSKNK